MREEKRICRNCAHCLSLYPHKSWKYCNLKLDKKNEVKRKRVKASQTACIEFESKKDFKHY